MAKFFNMSADDTLAEVKSSRTGLTDESVQSSRALNGKNALEESKKKSVFIIFLEQFKDLLVMILMIAAIISGATGEYAGMGVILAVILMNAMLGTVQYVKAEKSLSALKAMAAPSCKVVRNGVTTIIPSADVVVGDIIMLEAGDLIVADGRIFDNFSLQVNESSLTGESTAVEKNSDIIASGLVALGDQINMVFSGSLVTYGRAIMVVTATGMGTELGKIATLMNQTMSKLTPLQRSLNKFSKTLAIAVLGICAVVFGVTLYNEFPLAPDTSVWDAILPSFTFAIALAVAAIPEALGSIVTIVQAMGTQKMVKQHAIIKDLSAVETLGAVSVICSDKTGTLTQNKMTTQEIYLAGEVKRGEVLTKDNFADFMLINAMALVNDSTNLNNEEIGDPTEIALTNLIQKIGLNEIDERTASPRLSEIAFDSVRKLMSVLTDINGDRYMLTKGAVDVMINRASNLLCADGQRPMTAKDKEDILQANMDMSKRGLRVLSFGYKMVDSDNITIDDENGYTFIGLVSMIDPPREESRQAVADAKIAGIKTIMITGDHKITASAIATSIGIMNEGDLTLEGVELDKMSEDQLDIVFEKVTVYARVSPEHKIRIVEQWQKRGNIVAMTGDGVNDAPALKKADIGVAMGITGTEVSKDAANMILTDDNFATIVKSVTNGRNVYANIRNAIMFLLSGNMAAILCVLLTSFAGWPIPFTTIHLLFINLLTDSLPAIAIGMEPACNGLLYEKPRDPKQSILSKPVMISIITNGIIIFMATIGAYSLGYFGYEMSGELAATLAFITITLGRLFHGFNCRGKDSIFKLGIHTNWYSVIAFFTGVAMLTAVVFIPGINTLFDISPLLTSNPELIGYVILLAFAPTAIIQSVRVGIEQYNKIKGTNIVSPI